MPRATIAPKLDKAARKSLARRLRALLARGAIDMASIAETLEVEPELLVQGMRELRSRSGRVRSAVRFGHVVWWWEPAEAAEKVQQERR